MNVEIVTIGDELLLGFTVDTNSAFLARQLAELGIAVARRTSCGDAPDSISRCVGEALDRTGGVIVTGGLGPTADDMTKPAIASLFGRDMVRNENVARHLEERWRSFGRTEPIPQSNFTQAMIPTGAEILPNPNGSAPGIFLEDATGRWAAMLPGVPREMRAMFTDALRPRLQGRVAADAPVIRSLTLRTTGIGESAIADKLGELGTGINGLSLAFLPGVEGVDLRLTSRSLPTAEAGAALAHAAQILRSELGQSIYGEGDADLASLALEVCRADGLRVAVAESCTGGLLGARFTAIPGASDVFHGGIIAYDNRVKRQILGVLEGDLAEHGAVSDVVALQMAKGIRLRLGTEVGVSITGVAGPGGGSPEKPVGTVWVAVDVAEGRPPQPRPDGRPPLVPMNQARVFHLVGDRDEIRRRAAQSALDMLRRSVAELTILSAI
ncbi:MAG: competence/damage-inducible protein A [Gemmatimonadaceae bacterium]